MHIFLSCLRLACYHRELMHIMHTVCSTTLLGVQFLYRALFLFAFWQLFDGEACDQRPLRVPVTVRGSVSVQGGAR